MDLLVTASAGHFNVDKQLQRLPIVVRGSIDHIFPFPGSDRMKPMENYHQIKLLSRN